MTVPDTEVERRVRVLSQALRGAGLRLTHQRLEVAREIARSEAHPDTETVYRNVRLRVPTISVDTVYRTIATLEGLGLITRVDATPGAARYDANLEHHHHFVCTRCGLIRDVYHPSLDKVEAPDVADQLGKVESIRVQLRGLCKSCEGKENEDERRE
ncbi:MAG: transcriptional repressor [Actinobacteria bacterium]|nr:transcriptional repressor [Actinomycetota bacterium]